MTDPKYPSPANLIFTFLENVRRYPINSIHGVNPMLVNVNGEQMYIYIKNLSPAQLSNDNPDIWRIQLPKRDEFEEIKYSDRLFILLGYDYIRKIYTTWNPYWCKQRLNIAESCSMYSRLSLQIRVANTQKIEKMQLQNDGEVICIPSILLANYLMNIRTYYPEESIYVPVGSSIQKRLQEESQLPNKEFSKSAFHIRNSIISHKAPTYKLDEFGKLKALNKEIIEQLSPKVKETEYPDWEDIIKQIKTYYPKEATEKMNPVDWMKLFDNTKWKRKRRLELKENIGEKITSGNDYDRKHLQINVIEEREENKIKEDKKIEHETTNVQSISKNIVDIKKLATIFDNRVTSYKYFWFTAIISLAIEHKEQSILFDKIVVRMAAMAWPIVLGDSIELGEKDLMYKYLNEIQKKSYVFKKDASSRQVESSLTLYYDTMDIKTILRPLLNNVPYRLLSPWIKFTSNEDVVKKTRHEDYDGLYALYPDRIILNDKWWVYIQSHYEELCDFSFNSFIEYAKQYNSVFRLLKLKRTGRMI